MASEGLQSSTALRNGIFASAAWVLFCLVYTIWRKDGWSNFYGMAGNEFGDFVAGMSAPIAFGWLIFGFFLQGKQLQLQRTELELQRQELTEQRRETKRLADETREQRIALQLNERHTRTQVFLAYTNLAIRQLDQEVSNIASHFTRVVNVGNNESAHGITITDNDQAHPEILAKKLTDHLSWIGADRSVAWVKDRPAGIAVITAYCSQFERLLARADEVVPGDDTLRSLLNVGHYGKLYACLFGLLAAERKQRGA